MSFYNLLLPRSSRFCYVEISYRKSIRHRFAKSRKIRAKRFVPYREASTIVVLADMQGAQQVGEALRVIGSEGKKIVLYHFTFALQKAGLSFPGIDTVEVSLEDLCQGNTRPRSEICRRFESLKPDVLVDLTLSDYLPVAYLVASSNAPMRLGLKKILLLRQTLWYNWNRNRLLLRACSEIYCFIGRILQ